MRHIRAYASGGSRPKAFVCSESLMQKSVVDKIKRKTAVKYRSTTCVQQVEAKISYDPDKKSVLVEIPGGQEGVVDEGEPFDLDIADIRSVQAKDYTQDTAYLYLLFVGTDDAKEAFQFSRREDRDTWEDSLRSLMGNMDVDVLKQDQSGPFLAPIIQISLRRPQGPEVLISVEMVLGADGNKQPLTRYLDVPVNKTSEQDTQKIVRDFVKDNEILPSEKLSLFRYVRTLVERANVEQETKKLVEEINALHYDNLIKGMSAKASIEDVVSDARYKLEGIQKSIPQRIGTRGTNANIVGMILQRSTEKMKLVNDMGAKAFMKEKERADKRASREGFCNCAC